MTTNPDTGSADRAWMDGWTVSEAVWRIAQRRPYAVTSVLQRDVKYLLDAYDAQAKSCKLHKQMILTQGQTIHDQEELLELDRKHGCPGCSFEMATGGHHDDEPTGSAWPDCPRTVPQLMKLLEAAEADNVRLRAALEGQVSKLVRPVFKAILDELHIAQQHPEDAGTCYLCAIRLVTFDEALARAALAGTPSTAKEEGRVMSEPTRSDRGFAHFEPIGGKVSVYESSNAMGPHVWIGLPLVKTGQMVTDGRGGQAMVPAAEQLTLDEVEELIAQLQWFLEHHYQLQAVAAYDASKGGTE